MGATEIKERAGAALRTLVRKASGTYQRHATEPPTEDVALVDVTAREDERSPVAHAQKMEAIGVLASGIAHDFNNLLMGLQGSVDMIAHTLAEDHPARIHLEQMRAGIDCGTTLTRSLLAFCRKQPAPSVVFDLNTRVAEHVDMLRRLIGDEIHVSLDLAASDARVDAPPAEIDQALMNLVVNARDAMPSGGRIVIETSNLVVESRKKPTDLPPREYVILSVEDTGSGISEAAREHLFEPFFTTKAPGCGTGLGLAMVHGIAKRAGGTVRALDAPGRGARFEVVLPKSDRPILPQPVPPPRESGTRGTETILLVEDEHLVRVTACYYLEEAGYRVLEASTGAEALECCSRFPGTIALVVTDLSMPDGDGATIAKRIRAVRRDTGVVLMSAHDVVARAKHIPLGFTVPLLQKPFTAETLVATVRTAIDETRAQASPVAAPRSVLLVEDDGSARIVLSAYLADLGWDVDVVGNTTEARRAFRARRPPFSILLTDYWLTDGRGDELARDLRAEAPDLRVVYLTGNDDFQSDSARDHVLVKPVELPKLASELEAAVRAR
jgi:signal transduction histidine kinase/DNA-binding response OmpR family regulator